MTKLAAKGLRDIAERRVAKYLRDFREQRIPLNDQDAADLVAIVFDTLKEPDRDILEAGRRELALAIAASPGKQYERRLVAAVWRSMFAEAGG